MKKKNKNFSEFKKVLKIEKILGIYFSDKLPKKFRYYKNAAACVLLSYAFNSREAIVFDSKKYHQTCSGADFFLKFKKFSKKEISDIYTKKEHVFKNNLACKKFLKLLPELSKEIKVKSIILNQINNINEKPGIVMLLVIPAQAGRILGLLNFSSYKEVEIFPSQPTCISLFAPITNSKPHINFIDYYDRYYQGKQSDRYLWSENEMIISLSFDDFKKILENVHKSPHGSFKIEDANM